jgi:hypothetical protein
MSRTFWRVAVMSTLVLAAGMTVFAQRGGGFGGFFSPNYYSASIKYDGKFAFVRMSYPATGRGNAPNYPAWSHDFPDGEKHFMSILTNVSNVNAHVNESAIISFGDPEMYKYPVIYLCEPGFWTMTDKEVVDLRNYFLKGGFMIVDDFPIAAWGNFEEEMSRVFPKGRWQELTVDHPIFHSFFEIDSLMIPMPYNNGHMSDNPSFRAWFEDNDKNKRMYVVSNYMTDVSEYWEYSGTGRYVVDETNEAYKFGVNEFIYGITH